MIAPTLVRGDMPGLLDGWVGSVWWRGTEWAAVGRDVDEVVLVWARERGAT